MGFLVGCDSPNQEGVEGLDSEVVWIFTEPSAILVMPTSLLRTIVFFLFKEAYFYANWLPVTARCASRGNIGQDVACHIDLLLWLDRDKNTKQPNYRLPYTAA